MDSKASLESHRAPMHVHAHVLCVQSAEDGGFLWCTAVARFWSPAHRVSVAMGVDDSSKRLRLNLIVYLICSQRFVTHHHV
jgi:hypothetical protein